jgi:proteasome lid subunit RPN8/RPN11
MELPRQMFEEIVIHAVKGLPNEACGVIAGRHGRPLQMYPMRNAETSPILYRLDAKEQLDVLNDVDDRGWELLGVWHSHTHSEAYPSPTDRSQAHWKDPLDEEEVPMFPGISYLILSLRDRENPELRAFRFEEGEPVEEEVRIS